MKQQNLSYQFCLDLVVKFDLLVVIITSCCCCVCLLAVDKFVCFQEQQLWQRVPLHIRPLKPGWSGGLERKQPQGFPSRL